MDVRLTGELKEGEKEFAKIDIRTFAQQTISMFSGIRETVAFRFKLSLLDAAIDQFGTKDVWYLTLLQSSSVQFFKQAAAKR